MSRRVLILALMVAAACALGAMARHRGPPPPRFDAVSVSRADLSWTIHEAGELAPRDAILIKAPFTGRISFLVDDGAWVEQGATVMILSEEDEVQRLTDDRAQLIAAQQQLKLDRLKRAQAGAAEEDKVAAATRDLDLAKVRWRVLSSTPTGGMELVRLSHELEPRQAATARAREAWESAQAAFQAADDRYLEDLDREQDARDAALRARTRVDELEAVAMALSDVMTASERGQRQQAAADLPAAKAELAAHEDAIPGLAKALAASRAARDTLKPARDLADDAHSDTEADERELRVRVEIEKLGAPLALLELDEQAGQLAEAEAVRKRDQGREAAARGALTHVDLESLEVDAASKADELAVVRQKIAIAARPTAPEVLAEAQAKLSRAQAKSDDAKAAMARDLGILEQTVAVDQAKVGKYEHMISARSARFPALLEDMIRFTRKEIEEADDDDDAGRAELKRQLADLEAKLAAAKASPPNIIAAPTAGVCRLRHEDDRLKQPGDRLNEEDVALDLLPPANLDVIAHVNEANIARLRPGMRALVTVPALHSGALEGEVTQVSQVGKDKSTVRKGSFADVTVFDVHVRVAHPLPGFRQGMSVLVGIEIARRADVSWLPLAAVSRAGEQWQVLTSAGDRPATAAIQGQPFGDDAFIVTAGLSPGQTVYIARTADL